MCLNYRLFAILDDRCLEFLDYPSRISICMIGNEELKVITYY